MEEEDWGTHVHMHGWLGEGWLSGFLGHACLLISFHSHGVIAFI